MHHNHIIVLRVGKRCQVLSGESNLCTRAFSLLQSEKRCSHFDFPLWTYIKPKARLKFAETMVLLYSIMQFLQEWES